MEYIPSILVIIISYQLISLHAHLKKSTMQLQSDNKNHNIVTNKQIY